MNTTTIIIQDYSKIFVKVICYLTVQQALFLFNNDKKENKHSLKVYLDRWFKICDLALTRPKFRDLNISTEKYNKYASHFTKLYGRDVQKIINSCFRQIWHKDNQKRVFLKKSILNKALETGYIKCRKHIHIKDIASLPNCYYPTRDKGREFIKANLEKILDLKSDFYTDFERNMIQKCCNKIYNNNSSNKKEKQSVKQVIINKEVIPIDKTKCQENTIKCQEMSNNDVSKQTVPIQIDSQKTDVKLTRSPQNNVSQDMSPTDISKNKLSHFSFSQHIIKSIDDVDLDDIDDIISETIEDQCIAKEKLENNILFKRREMMVV